MQYIQTKTVYIDRDELIEIKAIEHDVKTRFIDFKFIAANKILDISHCIVRVYALTKNGKEIFNNLTIVDGLKGIARLELTDALLIPGTTEYMLKIYDEHGGILSSNIFNLIVSKDLMTGNAIEGTNEYTALDEALRTVGNIHATEVRSKENASNIAKITEKLDYASERMQDNTETIIYNLKNVEGSYGDCIVIKADDGTFSMIDCFMEENFQIMIQQLDKIGVTKLKYFFATHDHSDHIGNAPAIIEKYRPDFIVFKDGIDYSRLPATEQEWDTKGYHDRMLAAADKFGVQKIVANDQQFRIGKNDYIEAFASKFYDYTNENSMSVNYLLVSHGTKSLFPGDSTVATETHLQNRIGKIDLYKLSHHGADGGNSDKRFEELQARYCLIDRLDVYKKDIIKNFALKCLKYGGKVYSNDNNDMTVFKITRGAIYPCCNEYKLPLQFLDYYSGRYKMTNEAGGIATKGIYPYKSDFYFVKDDGFIAKNEWIKHDGIDYHASSSGALDRNCFIQGTFNEKPCYYWIDENCKMVIEPKLIYYNNNTYLIKSNTLMAEEEFYEYQANYYYAGKGGALKKNEWLYKDSNYYWLKFNGIMASEETLFIEGKWYDFNGSGVCTNPSAGRDTKNKE
ncbi:TPA: BppU family phage baseplate upper protein [Clostridium perfringens]|nr:BppU family phage baseplate upper protein [Clostridium perfringens]